MQVDDAIGSAIGLTLLSARAGGTEENQQRGAGEDSVHRTS
jgi:hypothetical protein